MPSIAVGDCPVGPSAEENTWSVSCETSADVEADQDRLVELPVLMPAAPAPEPGKRRIVFLNIDGVLNSRPDARLVLLDAVPCALLGHLLSASGAELVLCTPWRRHHEYITQVLGNFGVFGELGQSGLPVLDRTPQHGDASRRDLEILQWLGANRGSVCAWAALDAEDLQRWPSARRFDGHFVQVTGGSGLHLAHIQAALSALGCADAAGAMKSAPPELHISTKPRSVPKKTEFEVPAAFHALSSPEAAVNLAGPPPVSFSPTPAPRKQAGTKTEDQAGTETQKQTGTDVQKQSGTETQVPDVFRTAMAFDEDLADKMQSVLELLGTSSAANTTTAEAAKAVSPQGLQPSTKAGCAAPDTTACNSEFDKVFSEMRTRFA
mmetsp:Transcript_110221/g.212374  ORF Transcript_110221/g.212374 Transcript_110221/m.212374 type:complete len:379 (+) Transcript_110221:67-1203(+)